MQPDYISKVRRRYKHGSNPLCRIMGIWCSGNDILALRNVRGTGSSPVIPIPFVAAGWERWPTGD